MWTSPCPGSRDTEVQISSLPSRSTCIKTEPGMVAAQFQPQPHPKGCLDFLLKLLCFLNQQVDQPRTKLEHTFWSEPGPHELRSSLVKARPCTAQSSHVTQHQATAVLTSSTSDSLLRYRGASEQLLPSHTAVSRLCARACLRTGQGELHLAGY